MFLVRSETDGSTKLTCQKVFWLAPSFYPILPSGNSSLALYILKQFQLLKPPFTAELQWPSLGTWIFPGTT